MFGDINLVDEPGNTPTVFGRQVALRIYGHELVNFVLTDNSQPSSNSKRTPMPTATVKLIRKAVQKRFKLEVNRFDHLWRKVRNSINGKGRFIKFRNGVNRRMEHMNQELNELRMALNNNVNNNLN